MRKNKKSEFISITLFIIFIILVLTTNLFGNYYISEYTDIIQENVKDRLIAEGKIVSKLVSPEILKELVEPEDMNKPVYQEMTQRLRDYAKENDLMFVFYIRLLKNGKQQYILDSDEDPKTHLGLDYFEEPDELAFNAHNGKTTYSLLGEYTSGWEGTLSSYTPILDSDGNVVAVVGIDISDKELIELKESTNFLKYIFIIAIWLMAITSFLMIGLYSKKAKEYNNASIAKSQFLSKMSHEIRTPMNAIIGFSRMAKNTKDISKKKEYIDNITNSSDYLLQLINSILDISKIEEGKMNLTIEKTSLYEIMKKIETMMSSTAKTKNQKFTVNIDNTIPKFIYCDKTYLTQVIVNLISNALKFTKENEGEVSVKVSLLEIKNNTCNIQFIIKDNGIGIEEKYISHVFEAFEQGDDGITRKYGGTGLGLAISKLLVEMMKGSIQVESKLGEGSSFIFDIWVDIEENEEVIDEKYEAEENLSTIDCNGMKFLVIEDNEINQIIAGNILIEFGATVEFANNGQEGLEKFLRAQEKYDIIFMDIQMPIMDGFEATRKIREHNKIIPIIATTAEVFKEDVDKAIAAGMNEHIGKPLKVENIVSAIANVRRM